jgi:HlyD family secretion protein
MKISARIASVGALGVLAFAGWKIVGVVQTVTATPIPETPVTRVKRGPVAITVAARGDLQGGNPEMLVAPQVAQDTLVVTFLRQPGEQVEAGDLVAQFDTTQQEYNLKEAEADLAEAQQKVIQTESDNVASDEETRYSLEAAQNAVKLAELDLRKNAKGIAAAMTTRDAEIALEAAKNRQRQAEQDLGNKKTTGAAGLNIQRAAQARSQMMADMARKNIQNMTLTAKTSGYVSLQTNTFGMFMLSTGITLPNVQLGDSVRPGMAIVQLFDLKDWEVSAKVSELDRGHLATGQAVSVGIMALGVKTFPGHVKLLGSASGDAWDRKFDCRISLDQAVPEMRPGMSAYIVITAEKVDNVLWLPSQALFDRDGQPFVYFKAAGGFTPRDIALVKKSESQAVVTGLNEGDAVALSNPSERNKPAAKPAGASQALPK